MTLKNIPDPIHKALKKQAETNHRSLNQEILAILERAASGGPLYRRPDADQVLAEVREMRKLFKGSLTLEEMNKAKREGLP